MVRISQICGGNYLSLLIQHAFSATMFSWNPYEVVTATKQFRELYLTPNGFEDLPIWITEVTSCPIVLF